MRKMSLIFTSMVLSIILITSIIPSYSEYLSPKKQLELGIPIEEIECKENRLLVIRNNGNPACVSERTVERTEWEIIKISLSKDVLVKLNNTLLNTTKVADSTEEIIQETIQNQSSIDTKYSKLEKSKKKYYAL